MQDVKIKWQRGGLVLVCEKCFKERIPDETPEVAAEIGDFNLRDWLKAELKASGEWGPIRAIGTTCLDVCAKGKVTVAIDPQTGDGETDVFVCHPVNDKHQVYGRVIDKLGAEK